jgi:hypothetical protein
MNTILARTTSHRSREKLKRALGYYPQEHFSFQFEGSFVYLTPAEWEQARVIKGIRRARVDTSKLHQCMKW